MKTSRLILFTLLLVNATTAWAQSETLDMFRLTTPNGWQREKREGGITPVKVIRPKRTFCLISPNRGREQRNANDFPRMGGD